MTSSGIIPTREGEIDAVKRDYTLSLHNAAQQHLAIWGFDPDYTLPVTHDASHIILGMIFNKASLNFGYGYQDDLGSETHAFSIDEALERIMEDPDAALMNEEEFVQNAFEWRDYYYKTRLNMPEKDRRALEALTEGHARQVYAYVRPALEHVRERIRIETASLYPKARTDHYMRSFTTAEMYDHIGTPHAPERELGPYVPDPEEDAPARTL